MTHLRKIKIKMESLLDFEHMNSIIGNGCIFTDGSGKKSGMFSGTKPDIKYENYQVLVGGTVIQTL